VALTIHPSLVHGFDFSPEAHGYVLTVDQNVLFAAAGHQGDLFASLFVEPLAIDLLPRRNARAHRGAAAATCSTEAAWPQPWPHPDAGMAGAQRPAAAGAGAGRTALRRPVGPQRLRAVQPLPRRGGARYKEQWQVGQYAEALRVTPTRLNRLCLKLSGKSAFDMTQDRLMLEACRKLTYVPAGMASIAYELGFQDPAYFSRLFKKRIGVTPKEFRRAPRGPA
jgi:AraC family transcriptional activator of pobA